MTEILAHGTDPETWTEDDVLGSNLDDASSFRHRLLGIEENIVEDLPDLVGIHFGRPQIVRDGDADAGGSAGACELDRVQHEFGHRDDAPNRGASSGKRQQLREECRPPADVHRPTEKLVNRRGGIDLILRQFDVPLDDGEEVVEVVRNAAGQHAKRFQLARAKQFVFGLLALCDFSSQTLGRTV